MHLKEVRMENFKSFGHSLTVPFKPGFTAITGPNGAGKSNIADAILFVLGPRSARLIRAQRLTDLIYNGGKNEKPAKECEVSLAFDNADRMMPIEADEVVLTRRIRKAPKRGMPDNYYSYFYVNGRAASLKEFVDLLQHARISADGYNIVTQGAVMQMVEMTNVERRGVLDSIAGITEFDGDIEKAEKRRSEVEQNLERVNIILGEVRRSLSDLKRDRDNALKYADLKKRRDTLEAVFAFRRKEEIERQLADVHADIQGREQNKKELAQKLEEVRLQLKEETRQKQDIETKLAELGGAEGEKTREEIKRLQADTVRLEERMNHHRDEVKDLGDDKRALEQELQRLTKDVERLESAKGKAEAQHEELAAKLRQDETELKEVRELIAQSDEGSLKISHELAKLKNDFDESTNEVHKRRLEQDRYEEKRKVVQARLAELEDAKAAAEFELKDVEFQANELKTELKQSGSDRKSLEKELFDKRKRQAQLTEELNDIESALRRLQREFHELKAREEASASVGSGLNRAVEAVLAARAKGQLKGIHGTIADLGKVDTKYETALEVAAGNRMMSVVVEDDEAAASAIEFLRRGNLGRAVFLPLNKMLPAKPRGKALMTVKDDASLGFALDLVGFNKKYENAFSFVFGDTIVMKDLPGARRHMGGVRLVTLAGDLLEASGAMVGGSFDKKNALKFAGKDVSKLAEVEAELGRLVSHQEQLTQELVAARKRIQELETLQAEGREAENTELRVRDLEARRKEFEGRLEKTRQELESGRQELQGLEDALANNTARIEKMETHVAGLEESRKEKSRLMIKGTKKEWAEKVTKLEERVAERQRAAFEAEAAAQTQEREIELIRQRVEAVQGRLKATLGAIAQNQADAEKAKSAHAELEGKVKGLTKAESQMTGQSKALADRKEKLTERVFALNNKVDQLLNKIDTIDTLVSTARNKLPTVEEALGEVLMQLAELGIKDAPEDAPALDQCKAELQQVSSQMKALEPVNMMALEEFEKQEQREKEFLDEVARLNEQRENLVKVVDEIVARKKEGLMKVFDAVSTNFREVYARLSDGGEGYIELENPERPFDGGLVLKAKPKGKKVLRLQALSGGEKSMTALAFIFAIQEYEPSPFYVLDEVDMFLDGVNSELVAGMVKDNSTRAQFIIISLRKVTLKEAEHIYGVTMAGDGLSQMIANFDINMITEEGELVNAGKGGGATLQVERAKGGDGADASSGADDDGTRSIRETVKDMVRIEVDK